LPNLADKATTDHAMAGDLVVAPGIPLGIGQEQRHGLALVGVGARQAVAGVGRNAVQKRVALVARTYLGGKLAQPRLATGQDAVKANEPAGAAKSPDTP
jgi:hypothetical protein